MKAVHGDVHTCLRSSTSSEVFPGLFKFGFRPRFFMVSALSLCGSFLSVCCWPWHSCNIAVWLNMMCHS